MQYTLPEDARWMRSALTLAERSVGMASPNPAVGCVLIKEGVLIGQGWHEYDKKDHAEVVALAEAGGEARGATAYVTLEPCSHHGRTGPCADALIRAHVARVVVATQDPNPVVSGRGIARLRAAGVQVTIGVEQEPARRLNDPFARHIVSGLPLVTLKAAVSRDGRIAPPAADRKRGAPVWITSRESRLRVQRMRHANDAILTGINTVLADDPLLTDRTGLPRRRRLLRVVLDSELRLALPDALTSKLVRSADDDLLVFHTIGDPGRVYALESAGLRVERIEIDPLSLPGSSRVSLGRSLAKLSEKQILSVMIEAGAKLNTTALSEALVDRLVIFQAPVVLGDDAVPLLHRMDDAVLSSPRELFGTFGFHDVEQAPCGPDIVFEARRHDPWASLSAP